MTNPTTTTLHDVRSAAASGDYNQWVAVTNALVDQCATDTHPGVHTHERGKDGVRCLTCDTYGFECTLADMAIYWDSAGRPVISRTTQVAA